MEMNKHDGKTELFLDEENGVAVMPLAMFEQLNTDRFITNVFRRLWFDTGRDGDEFEEIFELVFGDRYEDDDDED